jgi:predicted  nucleic acid-binding Zn-ribbon protein
MSQTLSLYRLQQVDLQIDRVHARLQEIQKILADDAELILAREFADSAKGAYATAERNLKLSEAEAQDQRIKIEQTEASLYNGKGHSPKELLDLQNDTAALKRHLVTLENTQLDAMLALEEALTADQSAQSELQVVLQNSEKQTHVLQDELVTLRKELDKYSSERAAIANPIPANALELYDRLRQQRRGIAVAVINESSCAACGAGLSAAQVQTSRGSESIALCPSCGRILYGS